MIESRLSDDMCIVTLFFRIYSVLNDDDVTFVVGHSFFSFATGGSVSSMVSLLFNAPSIISACHVVRWY